MKKVIVSALTGMLVLGSLSAFADDAHHNRADNHRGGEHHQTWRGGDHRGDWNGAYRGGWSNGDSGNDALLGLAAGAILGGAIGSSAGNSYYSYQAPPAGYPYGYQTQCYYYPGTTQVYCPQQGYAPYGY